MRTSGIAFALLTLRPWLNKKINYRSFRSIGSSNGSEKRVPANPCNILVLDPASTGCFDVSRVTWETVNLRVKGMYPSSYLAYSINDDPQESL